MRGRYGEYGSDELSKCLLWASLILIVLILAFNALVNKLTGASIDSGIGGDSK